MFVPPRVSPDHVVLNSVDVNEGSTPTYLVEVKTDKVPRNFALSQKLLITLLYTGIAVGVQINSSINGSVLLAYIQEYDVSLNTAALTISLFLVGTVVGVIFCGPLSELHGRKNVLCYTALASGLITVASSFTNDFKLYLATRFFSGLLGSPVLIAGGSVLKDLFNDTSRAYILLAMSVLISASPSAGGFLANLALETGIIHSLSQINLIPGTTILIFAILALLFVKESFLPVVNKRLDNMINRSDSLKERIMSHLKKPRSEVKVKIKSQLNMEISESNGIHYYIFKKLLRPWEFLNDLAVVVITMIGAYYAGSMYLHVTNFPVIIKGYNEGRDNPQSIVKPEFVGTGFTIGLLSLGTLLLLVCAYIFTVLIKLKKNLSPELRLIPLLLGSVLIASSSFLIYSDQDFLNLNKLFAAQILHGAGYFLAQQAVYVYFMEVYGSNSASVISLGLVFKNLVGGLTPLVGSSFILKYNNGAFLFMSVVNSVLIAVILLLIIFGNLSRKNSKLCIITLKYKNYEQSSP